MRNRTVNEALNAKCPYCRNMDATGYGKRGEKQRFKCKNCGRTFTETSTNNKYAKCDKRLLTLFLNFLEKEIKNDEDFNEILKNLEVDNFKLKNIKVRTMPAASDEIICHNPKLIVCQSNSNIVLIKIPEKPTAEIDKVRKITVEDNPTIELAWQYKIV